MKLGKKWCTQFFEKSQRIFGVGLRGEPMGRRVTQLFKKVCAFLKIALLLLHLNMHLSRNYHVLLSAYIPLNEF